MTESSSASAGYRICVRCVMDTTDPEIFFDESGECSHCRRYDRNVASRLAGAEEAPALLQELIARIKVAGQRAEYDCVLGVSGGADSTYVAYKARELGLRPLAVHLDNGWNSELAVSNIEGAMRCLGIDLFTHVLDWDEFRRLQVAFLRASTPDGEIPTDHAIYAVLLDVARRHGIRFIVSGTNYRTESSTVAAWSYGHSDWRYIKAIARRHGAWPLRAYPHYTLRSLAVSYLARRIRFVSLLNYLPYDRRKATEMLTREVNWREYGGKHHESVYTRFYQAYVLPTKFNIDKRRMHLSDAIRSGLDTRARALGALSIPPIDPEDARRELRFVAKKLGLSGEAFREIMQQPARTRHDYPNQERLIEWLRSAVASAKRARLLPR